MDDAERREIKKLADDVVTFLAGIGVLDCSKATEYDVIFATALAYIIDEGTDPKSLTRQEFKEYLDAAAYNHKLAQKWLHAEKLTPH